jgi:hypothetical protein
VSNCCEATCRLAAANAVSRCTSAVANTAPAIKTTGKMSISA